MSWIKVISSDIARVRYIENTSILEVEFHSGGVYQYFNVPKTIFEALLQADSCGKFLHSNIKGKYRYAKV